MIPVVGEIVALFCIEMFYSANEVSFVRFYVRLPFPCFPNQNPSPTNIHANIGLLFGQNGIEDVHVSLEKRRIFEVYN